MKLKPNYMLFRTYVFIFAISISTIGIINTVTAQQDNNSVVNDNSVNQSVFQSMDSVLNETANTTSISDATEYIINITRMGNNSSVMDDNPAINDLVNSLVDTLRNTNATSIAASYVINITNFSNQTNSTNIN